MLARTAFHLARAHRAPDATTEQVQPLHRPTGKLGLPHRPQTGRPHLASTRPLTEEALTRLCYVASFFEDIYRTGQIRRFSMLAEAGTATDLDNLTSAVPSYVIEDIDQQMLLSHQPLVPYRALPQRARICGPVFAGSDDVPADADFVLGGLLLDCKATRHPLRLGREEIYQPWQVSRDGAGALIVTGELATGIVDTVVKPTQWLWFT